MDPIQAIAAHQVPQNRSRAEDIDAFYDAYAFESLHVAVRAFKRLAQLLRYVRSQTVREASVASKIASMPGRV